MNAAEQLARNIIANYNNQLRSNKIDLPAHVESLLHSLGATTSDSGGRVTYYGSDPIKPDRLPYGSACAIALAVKAILIAKIWKERTGEGQDIHVDVRKALRRFSPFLDGKWELVNGFPGRTDPYSPFIGGPDIVPTKDGKWIMLADVFPAIRQRALDVLKRRGGSYEALLELNLSPTFSTSSFPRPPYSSRIVVRDGGSDSISPPMGRYSGVREMIEMSKTPGEYKYPLTPLGSWQPSWL